MKKKKILASLLAVCLFVGLAVPTLAEDPVPVDPWQTFSGKGTAVADGSNTLIKGTGEKVPSGFVSVYTDFGGYSSVFPEGGFTTKITVDASNLTPDQTFSWTTAINDTKDAYLTEILVGFKKTATGLEVAKKNGGKPVTGVQTITGNVVTIESKFYEKNGKLAATLTLNDTSHDWVITDEADGIDIAACGGNRYGWFCDAPTDTGVLVGDKPTLAEDPVTTTEVEVDTLKELQDALTGNAEEIIITKDIILESKTEFDSLGTAGGGYTGALGIHRTVNITGKKADGKKPKLNFGLAVTGASIDVTLKNLEVAVKRPTYLDLEVRTIYLQETCNLLVDDCIISANVTTNNTSGRLRDYGIMSEKSAKLTVQNSTISTTSKESPSYFGYGIMTRPTSGAAGAATEVTNTTFIGCDVDVAIMFLDKPIVATDFDNIDIQSSTKCNVYYEEIDDEITDANFGTADSQYLWKGTDNVAKFARNLLSENSANNLMTFTVSNKEETKVERYDTNLKASFQKSDSTVAMKDKMNASKFTKNNNVESSNWETEDGTYGTVSSADGKITLTAVATPTDDINYYAPYTTFGRGKENYAFGEGFETSITFDMTKVAANSQLLWAHGFNGDTALAERNPGINTMLDKSNDNKISVTNIYSDIKNKHTEDKITGTLDATKPITVNTKVVPVGNQVKATITVSDGTTTLTASHIIAGAPSTYGGLRYGWVYFRQASKSVDVSTVTYRNLSKTPDPKPDPKPDPTPPYYGGGGYYAPPANTTPDIGGSGASVYVPDEITNVGSPSLSVLEVPKGSKTMTDLATIAPNFTVLKAFNIDLYDGSSRVTVVEGGRVRVELPFVGKYGTEYVALRYNDNNTITQLPAYYSDGVISFETNHFTTFAIAVKNNNTVAPPPTTVTKPTTPPATGTAAGNATPYVTVAILVVLAGALVLLKKKLIKN